jgi:hypothetical protein
LSQYQLGCLYNGAVQIFFSNFIFQHNTHIVL